MRRRNSSRRTWNSQSEVPPPGCPDYFFTNLAVTDFLASTVTTQAFRPLHAPDHFTNRQPLFGFLAKVTTVPSSKLPLQSDPHLIPAGLLVMVPLPLLVTDSLKDGGEKVVVTVVGASISIVHSEPEPTHASPQPPTTEPASATAVRVTVLPERNVSEQATPQSSPVGSLLTTPLPLPDFSTVNGIGI